MYYYLRTSIFEITKYYPILNYQNIINTKIAKGKNYLRSSQKYTIHLEP